MINYVMGDLLNLPSIDIIAHQVNCQGKMGSGVALQVKKKYPIVYDRYRDRCASLKFSSKLLGLCQIIDMQYMDEYPRPHKYVANLFGQFNYGSSGQFTNEEALEKSLISLKKYAKEKNLSVAIPYKIGCVRGGASWDKVLSMIEKVFNDYSVTIVKLKED